jgi:hypothetical protein
MEKGIERNGQIAQKHFSICLDLKEVFSFSGPWGGRLFSRPCVSNGQVYGNTHGNP